MRTETLISDRVAKLRKSVLESKPQLSCERLRFLLEAYQEAGVEPVIITRAKLFDKFLRGMNISIDDNPVVGTQTEYPVGVVPYPEYHCDWMVKEAEFQSALGKIELTEEDRRLLRETVKYWQDKCMLFKTKEAWAERYGNARDYEDIFTAGVCNDTIRSVPMGRLAVDYGKVLNKGLSGVIKEAEEAEKELSKLPMGSLEGINKRHFLKAAIISCNAVIAFANRYASLAEGMARRETTPGRKKELERISETCQWVPANPARNFYEAIQSFWFTHLATQLEACANGRSPGRFGQYMYPFYKKDKDEGRLTQEEAIELLELLFIKFTAISKYHSEYVFNITMGNLFQNISIGGVTPRGEDATNELEFLLLEAQKRVRLIQPTLSVLYHDKLSEEFLFKAIELVKTGIGMPAFFNSDVNIQRFLNHGASLEDARNHCIIGCVEAGFSHTANHMAGGSLNMAKLLELALNNGKDSLTGKQIGPQTGEAEEFQSYDELCGAVKKHLQYFMSRRDDFEYCGHAFMADFTPSPFASALVDDCIKNGMDKSAGGSRYYMNGSTPVGIVDLADSLAAIKKLVFEEKLLSMKELLEALRLNFEGKEELHQMLLQAPKYGNDDDYVDQIAREWYDAYFEEHQKRGDHLGKKMRPMALSITYHFHLGALMGALPSGRKAKLPLTDASVSAEPGKDTNGPTALIRSATKAIDTTKYASGQLNMKFHPSSLEGKEGFKKLISLTKTYMDLGGHHVQFNVVSADTLRDAQLHPENYRDLIVRVAGFSAFFIHLDRAVQEEIIKRTELRFEA